jgi:hypothetical protein
MPRPLRLFSVLLCVYRNAHESVRSRKMHSRFVFAAAQRRALQQQDNRLFHLNRPGHIVHVQLLLSGAQHQPSHAIVGSERPSQMVCSHCVAHARAEQTLHFDRQFGCQLTKQFEIATVQLEHATLGRGCHGGRARALLDQRHLAKPRARCEMPDDDRVVLALALTKHGHLRTPSTQDVKRHVTRITLPNDALACDIQRTRK